MGINKRRMGLLILVFGIILLLIGLVLIWYESRILLTFDAFNIFRIVGGFLIVPGIMCVVLGIICAVSYARTGRTDKISK